MGSYDIVKHPLHYNQGAIQPIEFIMANKMDFWKGNIIKYATRAGLKKYDNLSFEESEITDLKKVIQYAEYRINELKQEQEDLQLDNLRYTQSF